MPFEKGNKIRVTHGDAIPPTRLYRIHTNMLTRCYNVKSTGYINYGGRGITVCPEWKDDYVAFRNWALSNGYRDGLVIDRRDNNLGYAPNNCRWVTVAQSNRNQRSNRLLTFKNVTKSMSEWANDPACLVKESTLRRRIMQLGWTAAEAITTPNQPPRFRGRKTAV